MYFLTGWILIYFWRILFHSLVYDEFTVLIGWSKQSRYPKLSMVPSGQELTANKEEFENEEYLTRLPFLWTNNKDWWWVVKEFRIPETVAEVEASIKPIPAKEAKETVAPLVRDAISKIQECGLPYLEELSCAFKDRND